MIEAASPTGRAERSFSRRRVGSVMLRQAYLYKRTLYRWLEIFYWPALDIMLWGFITLYLSRNPSGIPKTAGFFLGALILWDIMFRSQQSVAIGFLEDVWSRNVLNVWASPIRPVEYLAGTILVGVIRVAIGAGIAIGLAAAFYHFDVFTLGLPLIPFVFALAAMGWAIGVVTTSIILRLGQGAEELAWALAFLFQPVSAVFYPVSVLPAGLRWIARAVPASWVFEGMRSVLARGGLPAGDLAWALGLDLLYIAAAGALFVWTLKRVRELGRVSRYGE